MEAEKQTDRQTNKESWTEKKKIYITMEKKKDQRKKGKKEKENEKQREKEKENRKDA